MKRTLWLVMVAWLAFTGPWVLAAVLGLGYLLYYQGVELVVLAALVDGGFGSAYATIPWYTITTIILLSLATWLAPMVRWQSVIK